MKKIFMVMAIFLFSFTSVFASDITVSIPVPTNPTQVELEKDFYLLFARSNLLQEKFVAAENSMSYYQVFSVEPKIFAHLELERLNKLCALTYYSEITKEELVKNIETSIYNIKAVYGKKTDDTILNMLNSISTAKETPEIQLSILMILFDDYFYDEYFSVKEIWSEKLEIVSKDKQISYVVYETTPNQFVPTNTK